VNPASDRRPATVDHYENFPVASWLCPPRLRPPIAAIYGFARTADDIADEGTAPAQERLDELAAYRRELRACLNGLPLQPRWRHVFLPLQAAVKDFALPSWALFDLLGAFEQDVRKTQASAGYATRGELLDYCRRSANPVGRLLLHLYGITDTRALSQSDCICTALQLINFWQDLSVDIPRGRFYVPAEDCAQHDMDAAAPATWAQHPAARRLVASLVGWSGDTMHTGSPLVHQVPGRAGWELRLVVQGGLLVLDKIAAGGFDAFHTRPRVRAWDAPLLLARALRM
jgi:squalene synthase HpnC